MIRTAKNTVHLALAFLAALKNGFPASSLTVIAITGTDGKTTTAHYLYQLLQKNHKKTTLISTIGAIIGGKKYESGLHTTTPSPFQLQSFLKEARNSGDKYVILETTSHAIDQNRVAFIPLKVSVLTNIGHEHLDYHKTFENYRDTKMKLLKKADHIILSKDEENYNFIKNVLERKKITTYSLKDIQHSSKKNTNFPKEMTDFNKLNLLAALTVLKVLGIEDPQNKSTFSNLELPKGRQEIVYDKQIRVIIDFAHTPESFQSLLPEIKSTTKGKLIHVFGAAGKRDTRKRSAMGKISSEYADTIILTAEDPRGESITKINRQIKSKIPSSKELIEVNNRKEAVETAIKLASKTDTVLITGKGHERSINYDGKTEIPWNGKEVAMQAVKKIYK